MSKNILIQLITLLAVFKAWSDDPGGAHTLSAGPQSQNYFHSNTKIWSFLKKKSHFLKSVQWSFLGDTNMFYLPSIQPDIKEFAKVQTMPLFSLSCIV